MHRDRGAADLALSAGPVAGKVASLVLLSPPIPGSVAVALALPSPEHKRPHLKLDLSQEADCQQASVSQRKENSVALSRLIRSSLKFLRAPVADVASSSF